MPNEDTTQYSDVELVSSGIPELDTLLNGGFIRGRAYLIQGSAGTGKSLLGQHFLRAGLDNGETVVYVHGEESERDILTNAARVGVDLTGAEFLDIGPGTDFFAEDVAYELVDTAAVESERFSEDIKATIEAVDPDRVLIDPVTQLQYVERDDHQYRKRLQSLIRFLRDRDGTVVATRTADGNDPQTITHDDFESLSDGVINLFLDESERRIAVTKHRGLGQQDGTHGLEIRDRGIEVYPRLLPDHRNRTFDPELLSTGTDALDSLLGGGIERGSVTFVSGPTGIGKSTAGAGILDGIADHGGTALAYLFDESIEQFTYRSEALGIPISDWRDEGSLSFREIEPLVRSGEEFAHRVVTDVDDADPDAVFIDGLSGYKLSLQGDPDRLVRRLHSLTRTLKNRGITVIVTDEADRLAGIPEATSTDASYIADNILCLTYVEVDGELSRAIGVVKKRLGGFDNRFHRFTVERGTGLSICGTFDGVQGILGGSPTPVTTRDDRDN
jgi:circadian clock protein KaiC